MLTSEQIANLKKGDKLIYNNNGRLSEWEVDYPKHLNNEKKSNIVFECNDSNNQIDARQVAVEAVAGGGECINKENGCVRVSMGLYNGRGPTRFSMLISDWENWELPESEESSPVTPQSPATSSVTVTSVLPANESTDVLTKPEIKFSFSGMIKSGSGQIKIIDTATSDVFTTISAIDTTQVKTLANILQIHIAVELNRDTEYQLQIDPGFILDSSDLPIDILGNNIYKFTTQS